jgi:hypothetical protein
VCVSIKCIYIYSYIFACTYFLTAHAGFQARACATLFRADRHIRKQNVSTRVCMCMWTRVEGGYPLSHIHNTTIISTIYPHTHSYFYTHTHTLSLMCTLSLAHTCIHTPLTLQVRILLHLVRRGPDGAHGPGAHAGKNSHTHTHTPKHMPSAYSYVNSLTHTHTHSLTLSHTHTQHIHTHTRPLTHTHTHTHTLIYTYRWAACSCVRISSITCQSVYTCRVHTTRAHERVCMCIYIYIHIYERIMCVCMFMCIHLYSLV